MAKRILSIRAEKEDVARWTESAKAAGTSLGDWIGERCNASPLPVKGPVATSDFLPAVEAAASDPDLVEHIGAVRKIARQPSAKKVKRAAAAESARASVAIPQRRGEMVDVHMPPPDFAARCKHHHGFGEVCYKCDPKFGVPEMIA